MAGIPVAFGAFAGGLWGGATSMMNLALSYQQYQQNEMALDELRQGVADAKAARSWQGVEDTVQGLREQQGQGQGQPPAQPDQGQPAAPAPATPAKTATPAVTPAGTKVPPKDDKSPLPPQARGAGTPTAGVGPRERQAYTMPGTEQGGGTGVPTQEEQTQGTGLPLAGTPIPSGRPAESTAPAVGAMPMPVQPYTAPSDTGQAPSQAANLGPSGPPRQMPSIFGTLPSGGYTPPQRYLGAGSSPPIPGTNTEGTLTAPPARTGPAPVIPPPQTPAVTTPGAGQGQPRGIPLAQAQPPAATPAAAAAPAAQPSGGGLLATLGIIPSAQAQEVTPGLSVAGTQAPGGQPVAPAQTSVSAGQTAAQQPQPGHPGTQPVLPSAAATPAPGTPNYTQVAARKQAPATPPVVPGQQGPSVQATPPSPAPSVLQVNPTPWHTMQLKYPELAAAIHRANERYGGGAVTDEELAYVKWRESGYETDPRRIPDGDGGASYGAMQIQPATWAGASGNRPPVGDFDPHTLQGSLNQAAVLFHHLAFEKGYGASTVQTHFAYARGDGAADFAGSHTWEETQRAYPSGAKLMTEMFNGGAIGPGSFPGRFGNNADTREVMTNLVRGAAAGPDGALTAIAQYTPAGLGLGNAWRSAQSHFEMYAMIKGNFSAIPQIQNYFAGLSHQGAMSNLASAYSAITAGDTHSAAQYLAKAYAFFPDGVTGRLAVDKSGQLWGQRIDEGTGKTMGQPFLINQDAIAAKMTELGTDPRNFLSTFQNYRKQAAEIRYYNSHADYFEKMPEVREQQEIERQRHNQEMEQQRAATQQAKEEAAANKNERVQAIDAEINKRYGGQGDNALQRPEDLNDRQWSNQSEFSRGLRYPEASGGANLGGPAADRLAEDITRGHAQFQGFVGHDRQGRPVPSFAIWGEGKDPKKDAPDAEVSFETGRRFLRMAPLNQTLGNQGGGQGGQQGMPTNPPPNPARQASAVGAGMSSPTMAMSGGFNLAGPLMGQQQAQPQPSTVS